jgi:hypothetical protein
VGKLGSDGADRGTSSGLGSAQESATGRKKCECTLAREQNQNWKSAARPEQRAKQLPQTECATLKMKNKSQKKPAPAGRPATGGQRALDSRPSRNKNRNEHIRVTQIWCTMRGTEYVQLTAQNKMQSRFFIEITIDSYNHRGHHHLSLI